MASTVTEFTHLKIPLEDIMKATDNFADENIIGKGDFGNVYKGKLMRSGKLINISCRRLDRRHGQGDVEFWAEISVLSGLKHKNLVCIIGYCDEKNEKIIISHYYSKGSLSMHLSDTANLTWMIRLRICRGIVYAIEHIHQNIRQNYYYVIHRNINSSTILLDDSWIPKLSGFEFSSKHPPKGWNRVFRCEAIGTKGYMDPEIEKTGGVTHKSDIYSMGIVLFEILCGRKAFDPNHDDMFLAPLAKFHYENQTLRDIMIPDLWDQIKEPESFALLSKVAYDCLHEERAQRPNPRSLLRPVDEALLIDNGDDSFDYRSDDDYGFKPTQRYEPKDQIYMASGTINEFAHLQIPLEEIVKATDNFADENIIGKGGFGNVYKGKLNTPSGRLMNISARRLDRRHGQGDIEFWTEISVLSSLKHGNNLVSLVGYCDEKNEKIIITKYYPKGSLSMHLTDTTNLTWIKRLEISSEIANAIAGIHRDYIGDSYDYVIHRNINSFTILLDDSWIPRLSGFEYSIKHPVDRKNHMIIREAIGTKGYMDPDIEKTGGVTHKSDIYSMGIVLFEILCGRKAFDPNHNDMFLAPLAKFHYENQTLRDIMIPDLWDQIKEPESFALLAKAAYDCLHEERAQRPDATLVRSQVKDAYYREIEDQKDEDDDHDDDDNEEEEEEDEEECHDTLDTPLKEELGDAVESSNPWKVKGLGHLRIRLIDILWATQNFSDSCRRLVSKIACEYIAELECFDKENMTSVEEMKKGKIPKRCYNVIIKRYTTGQPIFNTEIEILNSCKHHSIETLLGFCDEGPHMILVFEFSAADLLCSQLKKRLTWEKRLKICLEIAHGLNYIHNEMEDQKMVIHGAFSSLDIYLDDNERVKIAGFQKSLLLPSNQADNSFYIKDAFPIVVPYMDPVYIKTSKVNIMSDVYGFGVVMFEILCGETALMLTLRKEPLSQVVQRWFDAGIIQKKIASVLRNENGENNVFLNKGPNEDSLETFLKIAYQCLAETQNERPNIKVVIEELEKALSFQVNNKDIFRMSLEEIKSATHDFSPDNVIGGGGFGKVYKGEVPRRLGNGNYTIVAKRLDTSHGQGEQQYYNELQILYEYKHENVIGLVGYSNETDEKIIVYEHASKGSLDKYLNDASLAWRSRLMICIDFATGLDFLHGRVRGKEVVIHRDIKAANILLFDDWKAKIGDLGLSIISTINKEAHYVIDHACGTKGYLDPLYLNSGLLTIESDIYSFGVVLFEILCGRSTFQIRKYEGQYLPDFVKHKFEEGTQSEVVFEALKKEIVPKSLTTFQNIAYQCLDDDREKRPKAKQVLAQLKKALEFQDDET